MVHRVFKVNLSLNLRIFTKRGQSGKVTLSCFLKATLNEIDRVFKEIKIIT